MVRVGAHVRLRALDGRRVEGTVESVTDDGMTVVGFKNRRDDLTWSSIGRAEVEVGQRHEYLKWALQGAVAGGAIGLVAPRSWLKDDKTGAVPSRGEAILAVAVATAAYGALGACFSLTPVWARVPLADGHPPATADLHVVPVARGAALQLNVRF
jgi:hypothetical protein